MKEKNIRNEIEYTRKGDYYIPNIVVPSPRRTENIGKYGRMRERYLKEYRIVEYTLMKINNELKSHLLDIDDICKEKIERFKNKYPNIRGILEDERITEMTLEECKVLLETINLYRELLKIEQYLFQNIDKKCYME